MDFPLIFMFDLEHYSPFTWCLSCIKLFYISVSSSRSPSSLQSSSPQYVLLSWNWVMDVLGSAMNPLIHLHLLQTQAKCGSRSWTQSSMKSSMSWNLKKGRRPSCNQDHHQELVPNMVWQKTIAISKALRSPSEICIIMNLDKAGFKKISSDLL